MLQFSYLTDKKQAFYLVLINSSDNSYCSVFPNPSIRFSKIEILGYNYITKLKEGGNMGVLILALAIIVVVAIFSAQNALPVAIVFLFWKFQASLAIVIFLSALTGIVIASIIFLWLRIRRAGKTARTSLTNSKPP
jgi:uncharacterized integral membrane protein